MTAVTLMVLVGVLERLFTAPPSFTCQVTVRAVVVGFSEVLLYWTLRRAV